MENFRKQRNKTTRLNRQSKKDYFESLSANDVDTNRKFWETIKHMFDANASNANKIGPDEGDEIITNDLKIANTMNEYFQI